MPRPKDPEFETKALAAAKLAALSMPQKEISIVLSVNPGQVSKLLAFAREKNWLITTLSNEIEPKASDEADRLLQVQNLRRSILHGVKLGSELRRVEVVEIGSVRNRNERQRRLAHAVSARVAAQLRKLGSSAQVGVTWGNTVKQLVEALKSENVRRRRDSNFRVAPLCGEPLGQPGGSASSTLLAETLCQLLAGSTEDALSLAGIPAHIPAEFNHDERKVIGRLMDRVPAFKRIFGKGPSALAKKLDVILTSAGPAKSALGYPGEGLLKSAGIPRKSLEKQSFGDIGGALIPRAKKPAKSFQDWVRAWTGLKEEHLRAVASRNADRDFGGVYLFAEGREKSQVVQHSLRLGLVNELYVDRELAKDLCREARWSLPSHDKS